MKMKAKLQKMNVTGISYVIVNMKTAEKSKHILERIVDFKVHQDKTGNIWKMLNGSKDDFYIYNRCGILSDYVPRSKSYLGKNYVKQALFKAYIGGHGCAKCDADTPYRTAYKKSVTPTKEPCFNTDKYDEYCGQWAERGLCKKGNKYYGFMNDHCRKTCKFCTGRCDRRKPNVYHRREGDWGFPDSYCCQGRENGRSSEVPFPKLRKGLWKCCHLLKSYFLGNYGILAAENKWIL